MKKVMIWPHVRVWLCLPLSVALLLGAGGFRPKSKQSSMEQELQDSIQKEFVPVFRFAIASDLHIRDASDQRNAERFAELFRTAYQYSDEHPTYNDLDAVLLAGDIVNSGADEEYAELNRVVAENLRKDTRLISVMGNHEYGVGGHAGYIRNMQDTLDKHIVLKGFHIIGLSTNPKDTWHTMKQVRWMNEQLQEAKKDDPEKPIFTMQHGHIWNTVYVSRSWCTQMFFPLHAVYAQYPQVVNFSGHSHGPINHPLSVWQSGYTAVGTGTLNYFEMERDIDAGDTVPPGSGKAAQYFIVEVDAQNRVRLLPYNILTHDFFKTPSTTDDPDAQLIYQIDKPSVRSAEVYTAARKKTDGKPWFSEDAKLSVTSSGSSLTVTFDRAQDDVCVYAYRIQLFDKANPKKPVASKDVYAEYYFEPMPETQHCTIDNLATGKTYTVRVIPLNVWLQAGDPLETQYTMQ